MLCCVGTEHLLDFSRPDCNANNPGTISKNQKSDQRLQRLTGEQFELDQTCGFVKSDWENSNDDAKCEKVMHES